MVGHTSRSLSVIPIIFLSLVLCLPFIIVPSTVARAQGRVEILQNSSFEQGQYGTEYWEVNCSDVDNYELEKTSQGVILTCHRNATAAGWGGASLSQVCEIDPSADPVLDVDLDVITLGSDDPSIDPNDGTARVTVYEIYGEDRAARYLISDTPEEYDTEAWSYVKKDHALILGAPGNVAFSRSLVEDMGITPDAEPLEVIVAVELSNRQPNYPDPSQMLVKEVSITQEATSSTPGGAGLPSTTGSGYAADIAGLIAGIRSDLESGGLGETRIAMLENMLGNVGIEAEPTSEFYGEAYFDYLDGSRIYMDDDGSPLTERSFYDQFGYPLEGLSFTDLASETLAGLDEHVDTLTEMVTQVIDDYNASANDRMMKNAMGDVSRYLQDLGAGRKEADEGSALVGLAVVEKKQNDLYLKNKETVNRGHEIFLNASPMMEIEGARAQLADLRGNAPGVTEQAKGLINQIKTRAVQYVKEYAEKKFEEKAKVKPSTIVTVGDGICAVMNEWKNQGKDVAKTCENAAAFIAAVAAVWGSSKIASAAVPTRVIEETGKVIKMIGKNHRNGNKICDEFFEAPTDKAAKESYEKVVKLRNPWQGLLSIFKRK